MLFLHYNIFYSLCQCRKDNISSRFEDFFISFLFFGWCHENNMNFSKTIHDDASLLLLPERNSIILDVLSFANKIPVCILCSYNFFSLFSSFCCVRHYCDDGDFRNFRCWLKWHSRSIIIHFEKKKKKNSQTRPMTILMAVFH